MPEPYRIHIADEVLRDLEARLRNTRWPDFLAQRLRQHDVAVVNAGISGARLLRNKMGDNALSRFGRDVLDQPGVTAAIVMIGINDISWLDTPLGPHDALGPVHSLPKKPPVQHG